MNDLIEQLNHISYKPQPEQLHDLLERTWSNIKLDTIVNFIHRRLPYTDITEHDIATAELSADEVRANVYSNINMWSGTSLNEAMNFWYDLDIAEQDKILTETFPNNKTYGV